jgi:spore photoproduct lyase
MIETIYIESEIRSHPRTKSILSRFSKARIVECERYGEVFNPKKQNFRLQKIKPALIIARKHGNFILDAPKGFGIGGRKNYYFSHMLNCIYDCRYCFLQGMYRSANYVLFVNYEDFQIEINNIVEQNPDEKEITFFSGYDCDSLALESVTRFVREFLPFFQKHKKAVLELRTKSINVDALLNHEVIPNCVVAYSFTPENISQKLEHGVPPIARRIQTMKKLVEKGWQLGIRLDPLIYHEGYQKYYSELIRDIFHAIPVESIHSVSTGPMRFPGKMFHTIEQLYPDEPLFAGPLENRNGLTSYSERIETEMMNYCNTILENHLPKNKLFSCLQSSF